MKMPLKISALKTYRLILSSYRETWVSLTMVLVSLIVACAGLSAVLLINQGAKQSYSGSTSEQLLPATYQIVARTKERAIDVADYVALKKLGLSNAVALAETSKHLFSNKQQITQRRVNVLGIDFLSLLNQSRVSLGAGALQSNSEVLSNIDTNQKQRHQQQEYLEIFSGFSLGRPLSYIHPKFLKELGINESESLYFDSNPNLGLSELSAVEINALSNTIVMDIGELLALDSTLSISRVLLLNTTNENSIKALRQTLPSHLMLQEIDIQQNDPEMTESFYLNLTAMALLMFAVCLFIVMNACNLLIFKRFAMLKVFRQLGIGRLEIMIAHAFEFVLFGVVMSALGLVLGSSLAVLAAPTIRSIIEGLYRVELGFAENQWLILYLKVLSICLAGIFLALLSPIRQLNQSLSTTRPTNESKYLVLYLILASAGFASLAILIFSFTNNLAAMLFAAACVILSGCCLLIAVFGKLLRLVLKLLPQTFTLSRISLSQAIFLSKKTKIACCAFFIAATSNLGMNLMVDSFRSSTESWLEQRLVADHYLYSDDAQQNRALADLAKQHGIALYPRYGKDIKFNKQFIQLFSYPVQGDFTQAMVFESALDDVWQLFEKEQAVLINQQLSIRNQLTLGSKISFEHPTTGAENEYLVAGIIYDYGNPSAQILLPVSAFTQDITQADIFAVLGSANNIDSFVQKLPEIGIDPNTQFYQTTELLQQSMQVFDRTFIITDSLNLVTLLVASLSLACTIIILMEQSRAQTMLFRTMGVSQWQSRAMLLQQYVFLCLIALLAATPFGMLLSYVLIEQINYHAFNWSYPLIIDWLSIIQLYIVSLLIVVAIISLPIVYTTKQSLAQELKWLD